jgi:phage repressor protein C with HTH and peptisase S24 domain
MSTSERVKLLLNKAGKTQKIFAKELAISPARLNNYLSGVANFPVEILVSISELTKASLSWLITGKGEMYNIGTRARNGGAGVYTFPVYGDIAAGIGIEAEDIEPTEHISVPKELIVDYPGPFYCFKVHGVSMEPELHTGDYAIISAWQWEEDYNGALCAFRSVDGLLIKRLLCDPEARRFVLVPLNPTHKITIYDENSADIQIIGRLVAIVRKYN